MKFKAGDKVKCIEDFNPYIKKGAIGILIKHEGTGNICFPTTYNPKDGYSIKNHASCFELVTEEIIKPALKKEEGWGF